MATPRTRSLPICSLLLSTFVHTRVKHRTAQRFAVSSRWRHWKPEEKPFPWRNLQSTLLIGQVKIPSGGQLGWTRVPRPFLLTPRLIKYPFYDVIEIVRTLACHEKLGPGFFGCHKLSARTGKCVSYWSANTVSAIDSFCDEAGDLMEEIYQHDAKVLLHGRAKKKAKSNQFFFKVYLKQWDMTSRNTMYKYDVQCTNTYNIKRD